MVWYYEPNGKDFNMISLLVLKKYFPNDKIAGNTI